MAPKHGLSSSSSKDGQPAKRIKDETPESTVATDAGRVPFEVRYPDLKATTKKMLEKEEEEILDAAEYLVSPFVARGQRKKGELDQHIAVVPHEEWTQMKKYNNFIIQGDLYRNNQFVYIRGEDTPTGSVQRDEDFWLARIVQVRASNPQHVYALVAWMYWPRELPPPQSKATDLVRSTSGQRTYHGAYELVASNYMEVLDVLSFAGKAEVEYWDEESENSPSNKLYWRQTYCRKTQELSKIKEHCICHGHFNPEKTMHICDNGDCALWMHEECIIDKVLTDTYKRLVSDTDVKVNGSNSSSSKPNKIWAKKFSAYIKASEPPLICITDRRAGTVTKENKTWTEPIRCLRCDTELEK